jgi:hypothetical protein
MISMRKNLLPLLPKEISMLKREFERSRLFKKFEWDRSKPTTLDQFNSLILSFDTLACSLKKKISYVPSPSKISARAALSSLMQDPQPVAAEALGEETFL